MLWLCEVELEHYEYMGDTTFTTVTRLVEADSEEECTKILKQTYNDHGGFDGDSSTRVLYVESCEPVLTKRNLPT